ncbi:MAG: FAD-dependent thymidylate synthase [Syntrophobacteraceae bacterium]
MSVRFVKSSVSTHGVAPADESGALHLIELCGRTAYKSEDKITEDSAKKFVLMLKSHGHLSVLEHSNAVLKIEKDPAGAQDAAISFESMLEALGHRQSFHRLYRLGSGEGFLMAGNFRAWLDTLDYFKRHESLRDFLLASLGGFFPSIFPAHEASGQEKFQACRASLVGSEEQVELLKSGPSLDLPVFVFKFVCDRGITHEVVRHRVFSFTQESTRYVNYGNRGMVLILPEELYDCFDEQKGELSTGENPLADLWRKRAQTLFDWYGEDLGRGLRPEIARDILPNLLKSELFVSGRWSGWKHFITLRDSSQAHPRIRFIAQEVRRYFDGLGLKC